MPPLKLMLINRNSPGDVLVMTAAVRDLRRSYGDRVAIAVDTCFPELWDQNPYLSPELAADPTAIRIECGHPPLLDRQSDAINGPPRHYLESVHDLLSRRLGRAIRVTRLAPDLHLNAQENVGPPLNVGKPYWVMIAGGKRDLTTKWWPTARYQQVVDHFAGRIRFVQLGAADDHHPRLNGVVDLVGRTSLRQFVCLIRHCEGVLCPVTCAMHVAAAFDKPCVVLAGGREPVAWEMYPTHQYLHTVGQLPCCRTGGCWKARVEPLHDGDADRDSNLCQLPTRADGQSSAACMSLLSAPDVCRAIERYLTGKEMPACSRLTTPCAASTPPRINCRNSPADLRAAAS